MEISPGSSTHERDRKGSYGHRERTRSHSGSPSRFYSKDKRGSSRQGVRPRDRDSKDSISPQYKQRNWSRGGGGGGRDRGRNDFSYRKKGKDYNKRRDKRSRSRSRHRSPKRSGSSKKSKRRNSSGSSSSDLMDTSLMSELKKHGDYGSSSKSKKKSRKRRKHSSSSSSSSGEAMDLPVSSNGMNVTAIPPPPSFNINPFQPMFSQPPPPPLPPNSQFMTPPPRPPPAPFSIPPPSVDIHFAATASFSLSSIPPPPPQTDGGASSSKRQDPLPMPPDSKRIATRPVITTRRGHATNRPSDSDSWYKTNLTHYTMLDQIGEGTYGQVYKAVNNLTGEQVALKRVRLENEKEGFPITAIREIKILRQLHHKNIVRLMDIVIDDISMDELKRTRANFYLVFEYVDHDLIGLLESKELVDFNKDQICSLFKQLLEGLAYIHNTGFLHRDIKCSNILVNNKGELKIADLGLARLWEKESRLYTNRVITLWYRPPELLLGDERYGPAIDVWSTGCMLGELFTRKPLFNGNNEFGQLELISKVCGSPNVDNWPELTELVGWNTFRMKRTYQRRIREEFEHIMPREAVDLLDKMLTLNPEKRISAKEALNHPWIRSLEHTTVQPLKLPQHQDCHEMWSKKQKKSARLGRQAEGSSGSGHSIRATSHPRVFEAAPTQPSTTTTKSNGSSNHHHHHHHSHHHASSLPPSGGHAPPPPPPPTQASSTSHNNHQPVPQSQYQSVFFK
ncbi:Cyclin-dependent kinase 12 [Caenorhabditis elegans]|uniref:Isoform b of Cyclin-dependent kinase 12 n=1 Tax=Caenorhabditis elegans TaxID=6239 RepID=P46551-3|nr:Cyclin-dependent kinase 12 [Caenorhabditis elegans]CBB15978.1 Cyclin-dependent kinase 12 [Caenorhabditis elegans]|eukprot:NP_001254914.1 Cyclin-dependent kinase 12 [Caenorhabditis elegans]